MTSTWSLLWSTSYVPVAFHTHLCYSILTPYGSYHPLSLIIYLTEWGSLHTQFPLRCPAQNRWCLFVSEWVIVNSPIMYMDEVKLLNTWKELKNKTPPGPSQTGMVGPNERFPSSYDNHSSSEDLQHGIRGPCLPFFQSSSHMGPNTCSRRRCLIDECTNKWCSHNRWPSHHSWRVGLGDEESFQQRTEGWLWGLWHSSTLATTPSLFVATFLALTSKSKSQEREWG